MALESLLASMESAVADVAAVQPSNGAASGCNGKETPAVASVANRIDQTQPATAATACNALDVAANPALSLACTAETSATAQIGNGSRDCPAWLASIPPDLEARILAMAERWNYSGDDLAAVLAGARADPDGWRKVVETDEQTLPDKKRA